jgi:putative mRNA 3-end processing factor
MEKMCALYEAHGVPLGDLRTATLEARGDFAGAIVICPPSALHDRWTRRFPDPILAFASGWMRIRQRARQRQIDLPLIVSDHADWAELTTTIEEVDPAETWITHGRADALAHWCGLGQRKARALHLIGRDDEDET